MDKIIIKNLRVKGSLGADHWQIHRNQILIFNVVGFINFDKSDTMEDKISYSIIANHIQNYVEIHSKLKTLESLADKVALDCIELGLHRVIVKIEKTNALLHAASVGIEIDRRKDDLEYLKQCFAPNATLDGLSPPDTEDKIFINDLSLQCIIGVNPCERIEKQKVCINIVLHYQPDPAYSRKPLKNNYNTVAQLIIKFLDRSSYLTLEALSEAMADAILYQSEVDKVTIRIEKPSALVFADTAGVEVTRAKRTKDQIPGPTHVAYLGVGTNVGDRVRNLHSALALVNRGEVRIVDSSFLYESKPMYFEEQSPFLNAVIKVNIYITKIETYLSPLNLLEFLKGIETNMGRDFGMFRNGPRIIDLDILLYDSIEFSHEKLTIPHPRINERFFVLVPLAEY
jgi:2-amino-4-hydroxy-6-hydroxymethyldihydropteridine diphosphokinase